jgi:lipopolysaccharide transport system ATP-binding protein
MYVRLAFAVAAHLEPDILIVDEVLAVGDAEFRRKCLVKMHEVADEGRTVLFVSHDMGLIQSLCQRVVLLRNGSVHTDDTTPTAVGAYLQSLEEPATENLLERSERGGKGKVRLTRIEMATDLNTSVRTLVVGRSASFVFHVNTVLPGMSCCFTIYDQLGHPVTCFDSALFGGQDRRDRAQDDAFACEIDELTLIPGRYRINAAIMLNGEMQDHLEGASFFEVQQGVLRGRPVPHGTAHGSMFTLHRWTTPV